MFFHKTGWGLCIFYVQHILVPVTCWEESDHRDSDTLLVEVVDRAGKAEDGILVYSCASHNLIFWKKNKTKETKKKNKAKKKKKEKGELSKSITITKCE